MTQTHEMMTMRRRKLPPDTRPDWRDPDMPVIRRYRMGNGTTRTEVDPDYERRYREMLMENGSPTPLHRRPDLQPEETEMIRERIREWLGISVLRSEMAYINNKLDGIDARLGKVHKQISAITPGLARIIAKLDPQIGRNEMSPAMKAESDKLSEDVIRRLNAEQAVRDQYGYNPKD
jgi:hypothetical protein